MDNSFFEFRNEIDTMDVSMASGHDSDVIDNSMMDEDSFTILKKPSLINHATPTFKVVEESEESTEDEDADDDIAKVKHSSVTEIYSTDEDASMTEFTKFKRNNINQITVITSSDEEVSPEMVPRKGPLRSNVYSTPNPTPAKICNNDDSYTNLHANDERLSNANFSIRQKSTTSDKSYNSSKSSLNQMFSDNSYRLSNDNIDKSIHSTIPKETDESVKTSRNSYSDHSFKHRLSNVNIDKSRQSIEEENCNESIIGQRKKKVMVLDDSDTSDEEYDEDDMVQSAATRMSIMGVRPKDMDSDESDFIQSDESHSRSSNGSIRSTNSLTDLPEVNITQANINKTMTDEIHDISIDDIKNCSRISCSPIQSPNQDLDATMKIIIPAKENIPQIFSSKVEDSTSIPCSPIQTIEQDLDATMKLMTPAKVNTPNRFSSKVEVSKTGDVGPLVNLTNRYYDDEVKVVETRHDVIDISSEDEDYPAKNTHGTLPTLPKMRSPKKEPVSNKENSIKPYLTAKVNPFQKVVYVKKHQRDNEVKKLGEMRQEADNIEHLMETMALNTLPDKGLKLKQRLNKLKTDVKTQEEKVAAMLIEPDNPTAEDIARDGFSDQSKGLTWDDIQAASNQVQPRMFGKQAMSTHIAERSLILQRLQSLHQSLDSRPAEGAKTAPPKAIKIPLMDHQLHALAWLQWRETQQPKGGILADDMGLGKTLTMISLVSKCKEKLDEEDEDKDEWKGKQAIKGGTLVVCPASLLQQWASEVTRYCPSLSVVTQHGAARSQRPSALATHDLVLTTYHILQRDLQKNGVLMKIRWSRIILDEAHIVRNYKSATSNAVTALQGVSRWCLTGTPVQNKDLDVFALLKFLRCTPFDDLTMWKKWIDNKSKGGQERLSTIMRCLLLRRTKQQLKDLGTLTCLPERTEHKVHVSLTKDEMNVYQKVLVFSKTLFAQFLHQRAEKQADGGFLPKPSGKNDPYAKMHKKMVALQGANPVKSHEILVLLLRLRQLCCHCGLIASMLDGVDTEGVDEDQAGLDLLSELKKMTLADDQSKNDNLEEEDDEVDGPGVGTSVRDAIRSVLSPNNPVFDLARQSSKIKAVLECLKKNVFANKGEKAVVVSQWTSVLRLVERELSAARVPCVTLSGTVPVPKRAAVVESFNTGNAQVILLSLCAGGVGLNLCGGNHLLLLDPHWNPQLEQQAQDRVYRVGQTKHVHVYRFMTVETVEQSIRTLQEHKLQLAESVLTGARPNNASKLTVEDLKLLFNM